MRHCAGHGLTYHTRANILVIRNYLTVVGLVKVTKRYIKQNVLDIVGQVDGDMDGRLVGLLLMAVGVLARPDRPGREQAVSYANVVRDHGTPTAYRVSKGFPSYESHATHLYNPSFNQKPYSLQQAYPLSYESHLPYSYPVEYQLATPAYGSKGYQTYEAQSEEQDEEAADYSGSAEQDD